MTTKSKKIRDARIIATDIFMLVAVVAIVFLMMLAAMGFGFNSSGNIEQAGLLQISSNPSSAKVTLDGEELFSPTEINKLLSAGNHEVKITKTGYDTWKSNVKIDAGLLTSINWVRLFPLNPTVKNVDTFTEPVILASVSNSRENLILTTENSDQFEIVTLQNEQLRNTKIKFEDFIKNANSNAEKKLSEIKSNEAKNKNSNTTTDEKSEEKTQNSETNTANAKQFSIIDWSGNNQKILLTQKTDKETFWYLLDTKNIDRSLNLTTTYGKNFTQILPENDSADKLWALADGELLQIDINDKKSPVSIAKNVYKIANNYNKVAFIALSNEEVINKNDKNTGTNGDSQTRKIFTYQDGEEAPTVISDLGSPDADAVISLGTYWSKDWLAYNVDKKFTILHGQFPSYGKSFEDTFITKYSKDLEHTPKIIGHNFEGRIILVSNGKNVTSYDVITEITTNFESDTEIAKFNWLDGYLIWTQDNGKIIVRDFDGNNRRELITKTENALPVALSENNKYLYYFTRSENVIPKTGSEVVDLAPVAASADEAPVTTSENAEENGNSENNTSENTNPENTDNPEAEQNNEETIQGNTAENKTEKSNSTYTLTRQELEVK